MMNRRTFLSGLPLGALSAPLAGGAQQPGKVYRIGILSTVSASTYESLIGLLRHRLRDLGYDDGKNLVIEYRWAQGELDRLPGLAAELVALKVDVIVTHSDPGARAAKQATTTIPIVVVTMSDPLRSGLVASLARPGGNLTGFSIVDRELDLKRLELLKEVVPKASRLGVLGVQGTHPSDVSEELSAAARSMGVGLHRVRVRVVDDFPGAFSAMAKEGVSALLVANFAWLYDHTAEVAALALKHRLPTIGGSTIRFAQGGGLLAYGPSVPDLWRRAAGHVDRILKGAKPGDLPIEQPTKFELVINLKTAKALGLTIPQTLLLRADQVIQ